MLHKMKTGKTPGLSDVSLELIAASVEAWISVMLRRLRKF